MAVDSDLDVVTAFEALLAQPKRNENEIQKFLEEHTALAPRPVLHNHRLHFNCLISKFPIGERIADLAYLTKSSIEWTLVLIELEDSGKNIFRASSEHHGFSAEMNDAIAQIDVWRRYWVENANAVIETLDPLLRPEAMRTNKVSLECVLVIGRSEETDFSKPKRRALAQLYEDKKITVMTYDSLLRAYADGRGDPCAVLTKRKEGYRLKSVEALPKHIFSRMYPEHLTLAPAAEVILRKEGYDIDAWKRNELLLVNEKWAKGTAAASAASAGSHPGVVRLLGGIKA